MAVKGHLYVKYNGVFYDIAKGNAVSIGNYTFFEPKEKTGDVTTGQVVCAYKDNGVWVGCVLETSISTYYSVKVDGAKWIEDNKKHC